MVASSDDMIKHLAVVILIDTSCVREYTILSVIEDEYKIHEVINRT